MMENVSKHDKSHSQSVLRILLFLHLLGVRPLSSFKPVRFPFSIRVELIAKHAIQVEYHVSWLVHEGLYSMCCMCRAQCAMVAVVGFRFTRHN